MLYVNDLMTVVPNTVSTQTTLRHIIELMKTEGCRQVPVVEHGKIVGIVTDRDVRLVMNSPMIVHGKWQDEELLDQVKAESCMTPNPMTVTPETSAYEAAKMLSLYKFGSLPVIDNGILVGIVTVTDYLDYFASMHPERVIEG